MKIRKLPSGNYNAQIVVGRKADGTRNVKSITAKTEWEVMKRADEFIRLNKDMNPDSISVKEALISYIDSKRHVIAPTTLYGYESLAKNRLLSIQGHMLTDLKIIDIQRAINIDAQQGMSHKTLKSAYALLRSAALLFGVELPSIRKLRLPPKSVKDELPPLDKVLTVIIGSSVELPCLLSVWCGGMRISEVRGLKYSDIYEEDGSRYIHVRRARVCINGHDVVENRNKTEQSTRDIPIPDYIYNLIPQN